MGNFEDLPEVEDLESADSEQVLRSDLVGRARARNGTEAAKKKKPAELDSTSLVELDTTGPKQQ